MKERLLVIGNGMAGARLVEDLLARGGKDLFDIEIFGDEPYGNYNRILLSNVLAKTHDPKDIFINPLDWYAENGVKLHAGCRVSGIDRAAKRVFHGDGSSCYDKLVIATGSNALVPKIDGIHGRNGKLRDDVHVFRTLDDCRAIAESAVRSGSAVVIGGGLLGLEAARGLQALGVKEVHVVHLVDHLMEMQLDSVGGRLLGHILFEMGFKLHLKKNTREVLGKKRITGVRFADGSSVDCDMVVVAAGIRPNVGLARDAGLLVNRGILVGDDLQTNDDPSIYAVGECAEHHGRTYGLVAPLWEQTRVLADRLSGRNPDASYTGSRVATKLKVMGIDLNVMGDHEAHVDDEEIRYVEEIRGVYKKLLIRRGRLAGAILLGDASAGSELLRLFDRGEPLPDRRSDLLFPNSGPAAPAGVDSLPDSAQICNCNGVSKGQLVAAVRKGCRSLKMLCDVTRAGMGCGSCKDQVERVLEYASEGELVEDPSIHYYVPGIPMTKPELVAAVRERGLKSVSAVFAALAGGKVDAASKMGLSSLLRTLWGSEYVDERDARFINDRVHANVQNDGTFSVVPGMSGGVTNSAELRRIADVADKYAVRMIKITGGQRIDLLGLKKEQLPEVWKDLGMRSGHAYAKAFRTVKTCVGTEFCRFGLGDSTRLGIEIEERFKGLEAPGKLKLAVAGCPRNCSEAYVKDVGVVAVEGQRWEIYVGGAAGAHVRKGDLLGTFATHQEVLRMTGRFLQYYRENAKYLERTYAFVPRVGIERIKAIVVEDAEGIGEALDRAMDASIEAYRDPWLEASAPVHPFQFQTVLNA